MAIVYHRQQMLVVQVKENFVETGCVKFQRLSNFAKTPSFKA